MPKDPKKQQKAVMKKRRKDKVRHKKAVSNSIAIPSERTQIRNARRYPIHECLVSADWNTPANTGLTSIIISRKQLDGRFAVGVYLLDVFCLGLKDTFARANGTAYQYNELVSGIFSMEEPEPCSPELAHQLVYQSIDYAAQFGFKPQKDFKWSQHILEPRGTFPESHDLTFGKDGKPLYISGPHDNVNAILAKLDKNPGAGNYHYVAQISDLAVDIDDLIELDEEEWDEEEADE